MFGKRLLGIFGAAGGAAVGSTYGKAAGDKLTALRKNHILIAADLVGAAKAAKHKHLDQTLTEATDQLKGNYAASAKDFDAIEAHILGMAEMQSDGIVAQFPQQFIGEK